jgi:hypothetical protein
MLLRKKQNARIDCIDPYLAEPFAQRTLDRNAANPIMDLYSNETELRREYDTIYILSASCYRDIIDGYKLQYGFFVRKLAIFCDLFIYIGACFLSSNHWYICRFAY